MDLQRLTPPQILALASMAVVAVAAFLPWVSVFGISASGLEGDGVLTLLLALAGAAVVLVAEFRSAGAASSKGVTIAVLVLGGLVTLIALIDMNGAAAIGLYLTLLGGLAWVGAGVWQLVAPAATGAQAG